MKQYIEKLRRNKNSMPIRLTVLFVVLLLGLLAIGCQQPEKVEEKPVVALGVWVDSHKIAEKDNATHPIKFRVNSITRDQKVVAEAIYDYNMSGTGTLIGQLSNDNLEFCMAEYSAFYPEDFPQNTFGITDVAVPFEIVSLTGGTISVDNTIYHNLATTWEIGDLPEGHDFKSGDTYNGKIVFVMVKGYSEYLIHEVKNVPKDADDIFIRGE